MAVSDKAEFESSARPEVLSEVTSDKTIANSNRKFRSHH